MVNSQSASFLPVKDKIYNKTQLNTQSLNHNVQNIEKVDVTDTFLNQATIPEAEIRKITDCDIVTYP